VTRALLAERGTSPDRFFRHHFFTYGHRNVVRAVASGLADSGSVDGYVHDVMADLEPELVARTRVIRRSEWLGFPPVACRRHFRDDPSIITLAEALRAMPASQDGKAILGMLRLDGFADADPGLFDGIAARFDTVRNAA
jgi:phosphonate transport system substrate-binding protein